MSDENRVDRPTDRPAAIENRRSSLIWKVISPLRSILPEIAAVCSAFLIGAIILWATGHPIGEIYILYNAFYQEIARELLKEVRANL